MLQSVSGYNVNSWLSLCEKELANTLRRSLALPWELLDWLHLHWNFSVKVANFIVMSSTDAINFMTEQSKHFNEEVLRSLDSLWRKNQQTFFPLLQWNLSCLCIWSSLAPGEKDFAFSSSKQGAILSIYTTLTSVISTALNNLHSPCTPEWSKSMVNVTFSLKHTIVKDTLPLLLKILPLTSNALFLSFRFLKHFRKFSLENVFTEK